MQATHFSQNKQQIKTFVFLWKHFSNQIYMTDNLSAFLIIDTELGSQWSFECVFFRRSSLFQEANFWLLMRAFFLSLCVIQ